MTDAPTYIGTAGWSVPSRYADRFPADGTHLERYAQRLNAAEIKDVIAFLNTLTDGYQPAATSAAH